MEEGEDEDLTMEDPEEYEGPIWPYLLPILAPM